MGNVKMRHPDREDTVEVSERAFDVVWSKKGWELVNPYTEEKVEVVNIEAPAEGCGEAWNEPVDTDPVETRIPTLETMDEADLREAAKELGIEGADDLTANELRSLIGNTPDFYNI